MRALSVRSSLIALVVHAAACEPEQPTDPVEVTLLEDTPVHVCDDESVSLTLGGENPGIVVQWEGDSHTVVPPEARFERDDGLQVAATTLWQSDTGRITVTPAQPLSMGTYALVVERTSDGAEVRFDGVVKVTARPSISATSGGAICETSRAGAELVAIGEGLAGVTVQLGSATVEGVVNAAGTELRVPVPGFLPVGAHTLTVTADDRCGVPVANAVVITSPPVVTGFSVGAKPVRLDYVATRLEPVVSAADEVAAGTVDVVVSGSLIPAGSELGIDSQFAVAASDGQTLNAARSASAGTHALSVRNGPCTTPVGSFSAIDGGLGEVFRLSPNVVGQAPGQVIDLHADLSAATEGVRLFVDRGSAASPRFLPLDDHGLLGTVHGESVWRYALPQSLPSGGYDVWVLSGSGVGARFARIAGGLYVTADPVPLRLVWSETTNVANEEASLFVVGCGFAGAAFYAVDHMGIEIPLVAMTADGGEWTAGHFDCASGVPADSEARLQIASLPLGAYRLRVRKAGLVTTTHEALHGFVKYGLFPTLDDTTSAGSPMAKGRRLPMVSEVSDRSGRRYVVVAGGDTSTTVSTQPVITTTTDTSYEYAPMLPDGSLGAWVPGTSAGAWPIAGSTSTYGAAMVADGSFLYLLGGTATGSSAETALLVAQPLDPHQRIAFTGLAADTGNVPVGVHHYRIGAEFTDASGTFSVFSGDWLSVQNASPAQHTLSFDLPCFAGVSDVTVRLYRNDQATLPSTDADMRQVASETGALACGARTLVDDSDTLPAALVPLQAGVLSSFRPAGAALASARFGLSANIVAYTEGSERRTKIVAIGGVRPDAVSAMRTVIDTDIAQEIALAANGGASNASTIPTTALVGQAFMSAHDRRLSGLVRSIQTTLGIFAAPNTQRRQSVTFAADGSFSSDASVAVTGITDTTQPFFGFAPVGIGDRVLFFGGTNTAPGALPDNQTSTWQLNASTFAMLGSLANDQLLMGSIALAGRLHVFGGAICTDPCDDAADLVLQAGTSVTPLSGVDF